MSDSITGYLLTRGWRDTPKGVELTFWCASEGGPVRLIIEEQEAVCFIDRSHSLPLPNDVRRQSRELKLLNGEPVDALYFRHQRDLQTLRQSNFQLAESDVKPTERYLMERFIAAGLEAGGKLVEHAGVRTMVNPRLRRADVTPTLKALSIDIETRGSSDQLYSIAGALMPTFADEPAACVFMIGEGEDEQREGYTLRYCSDEAALLHTFFGWLHTVDPDLIIGWSVVNFDLSFLDRKCRALAIPFAMGRGNECATILQPTSPGQRRIARIPGRGVLDGVELLKAGFWAFESFSLDNVAHELLGTGKLITNEQDKVAEINRLFREDRRQLAEYNMRDCTLVNEIFAVADLIPFAVQRANLTGLAIDRLGGSVAALDNLYLPRLHRHGFVAPDVQSETNGLGSPGGHVLESMPGLYDNVLVLDFKSLYPSIIRTFFIDPLGLAQPGDTPVPGFHEATFSRDRHVLPGLIEELWQARDAAKRAKNAPLSQAIKIIMNSFYGVLGSSGCRFHSQKLASSITRRGHEIITKSRDWIKDHGYQVIYGDTDSLFVLLGPSYDNHSAQRIGQQLMSELNVWWCQTLAETYAIDCYLEVEFDIHFTRFLMPTIRGMQTGSKKRYAGLIMGADGTPKLVVKGLEAARSDWTPLARNFQRELYRRVFLNQPFDDYIRETADALQAGKLDGDLIYRKRMRRRLEEYKRNVPPHVQAARKLNSHGSTVRYVMTRNGPEPVGAQQSEPDYQHYLDKQLAPAADGILQFLNTSFKELTGSQMQMF
ncbi:MAG: DNA polymerase II [Hyphomicrobiaceae bacterium]